jgi:phosphatidate phosphatase LPIN
MNYVRSITSSVSKGWNSINPATLSGAIDTIVVEHEDGSLACSPFHVRFGKYQILRPSDKKVEFRVNGELQDYSMKLGEGGEAFFVFETTRSIPAEMQTSPIASPVASPEQKPLELPSERAFDEPEPLDLDASSVTRRRGRMSMSVPTSESIHAEAEFGRPKSGDWWGFQMQRASTDDVVPSVKAGFAKTFDEAQAEERGPLQISREEATAWNRTTRSASPPPVSPSEAFARAIKLSKKLHTSNIPNKVTETGNLELDMTGYKSSEEDALRAEVIARRILSDELAGDYDIGALIGADEHGNLWIYSSEEAKAAAMAKTTMNVLNEGALVSTDALSDPGYQSDSGRSDDTIFPSIRRDSDSALGLSAPQSPEARKSETKTYAKTLRLTSEQLGALNLKPGANTMSFTVNRSKCEAHMYYWKHDVPIVISDIDGTITKSDALGHVLNRIGRDWTHQGVAKLYTDIVNNGYNIFYLTSRSVGLADTTRAYLNGVVQENYRLPKGPVIMSPDRTIAALRREIYLRKPEVSISREGIQGDVSSQKLTSCPGVQNGLPKRHHAALRQTSAPNTLLRRFRQPIHRRAIVSLRQHPLYTYLHNQLERRGQPRCPIAQQLQNRVRQYARDCRPLFPACGSPRACGWRSVHRFQLLARPTARYRRLYRQRG